MRGRQMASELERAKERRRIVDYDVSLFVDGVREYGEYAAGLSEWLGVKIPGSASGRRSGNEAPEGIGGNCPIEEETL